MSLKPELSVHFIDCGQGNMTLLVTPDEVVMYDCRIVADDEERILDHLRTYIPVRKIDGEEQPWIDWFICSHRDRDHFHGLKTLNEHFPIRGIVDPGTTSGSVEGDENQYYMALRRRLIEKYGKNAVIVPEPSLFPLFNFGGVLFYCLCSGIDDPPSEDGHYGNNVFQVDFVGRRILLTGDSDWRSWQDRILPEFKYSGLLKTTVMVASHHGSRSFFVDSDDDVDEDEAWKSAFEDHLEYIQPTMTLISCGAQGIHNHPNSTAFSKYEAASKYKQVYLTREKGTLIGRFYRDGRWTVTPSSFLDGWQHANFSAKGGRSVDILCKAYKDDRYVCAVPNGETIQVGHSLRFFAVTSGGFNVEFGLRGRP